MTNKIKMFRVGGCVRDEILGKKSKDIDYSVEAPSFEIMITHLKEMGVEIWKEFPEYFTARGKLRGEAVDFVLCRKDGAYRDNRRPDSVEIGTLFDDLARRDFTMNAIAIDDETGKYIDPFDGEMHLRAGLIEVVGSIDRLREDPLRIMRALRFSSTHGFTMSERVRDFIKYEFHLLGNISRERIKDEMNKMFEHDIDMAFAFMRDWDFVFEFVFKNLNVSLSATLPHIG